MGDYPVVLLLAGRPAVVVGGGDTAEVAVRSLLEAGARVQVISPELNAGLRDLASRSSIAWTPRPYLDGDLEDAVVAFAATPDAGVNLAACQEAERRGIPVNLIDDGAGSTFHRPESFRRGPVVVAVSAGGAGPELAHRLRRTLERDVPPLYGAMAEIIERYRQKAAAALPARAARRAYLRDLVAFLDGPEVHEDLAAGHLDGALAGARDLLRKHSGA